MNYVEILVCGVLSMVLGFIWYGPLFGKQWMKIIGATNTDKEKMKGVGKLYATSFVLALFQAYILSLFITGIGVSIALKATLMMWAGLVVPVLAGASMWNNDSAKISWWRFLIQASYYFVLLAIFATILGR